MVVRARVWVVLFALWRSHGARSAAAAAPGAQLRYPQPARLVAIGDVHGDVAALRATLQLAGAIDAMDRWCGGSLVVVQVGDLTDRGGSELEVFELVAHVQHQAAAAGGAFHVLVGNHEIMNAIGDFRYGARVLLHGGVYLCVSNERVCVLNECMCVDMCAYVCVSMCVRVCESVCVC